MDRMNLDLFAVVQVNSVCYGVVWTWGTMTWSPAGKDEIFFLIYLKYKK